MTSHEPVQVIRVDDAPVQVLQLDTSDDTPSVVYVPGVDGISQGHLENALAPLVASVAANTADIEYLKTTGGGTPTDPFVDWFQGDGPPPTVIPGAARGDMYFDRVSKTLHQLQ